MANIPSASPKQGPGGWLFPVMGIAGACIALVVFGALLQVHIESKYCLGGVGDPDICSPWVPFFGSIFKALFVGIAAYVLVSMDVALMSYESKLKMAWVTLAFVVVVSLAAAILAGHWEALVAAAIGGITALSRIKRKLNSHGQRRSLGVSHLS
jgi:hypothetical protein